MNVSCASCSLWPQNTCKIVAEYVVFNITTTQQCLTEELRGVLQLQGYLVCDIWSMSWRAIVPTRLKMFLWLYFLPLLELNVIMHQCFICCITDSVPVIGEFLGALQFPHKSKVSKIVVSKTSPTSTPPCLWYLGVAWVIIIENTTTEVLIGCAVYIVPYGSTLRWSDLIVLIHHSEFIVQWSLVGIALYVPVLISLTNKAKQQTFQSASLIVFTL